jgi:hypothetical protein
MKIWVLRDRPCSMFTTHPICIFVCSHCWHPYEAHIVMTPKPEEVPAAGKFPKFCPDCDKGIRGGCVCQTCGGSGESAASLFAQLTALQFKIDIIVNQLAEILRESE